DEGRGGIGVAVGQVFQPAGIAFFTRLRTWRTAMWWAQPTLLRYGLDDAEFGVNADVLQKTEALRKSLDVAHRADAVDRGFIVAGQFRFGQTAFINDAFEFIPQIILRDFIELSLDHDGHQLDRLVWS